MSDKTLISNVELELTQRIQMHFPRGVIPSEILQAWNACSIEALRENLLRHFNQEPKEGLLSFIGTVSIPATTAKFVAKNKFKIDTSDQAPVKINYVGDNFNEWFLKDDGKIEDQIAEQTLRYGKLRKSSVDGPIIAELGGEEKAETTLAELHSLMSQQPNGEDGVLLINGYANIFYVRDINGVLRAVDVRWHDDGWDVGASSVEFPNEWNDGYQIFARNF